MRDAGGGDGSVTDMAPLYPRAEPGAISGNRAAIYNEPMSKAKRRERVLRLLRAPRDGEAGMLAVREKDKTVFYVFREIPCEIGGRAFAMHRLGLGTLYHVRVGRPSDCSCE